MVPPERIRLVWLARDGQAPLDVPELNGPQAIHIWFFPTKTQDGLAWRQGFWVSRVVKTFSFAEEDSMYTGAPLKDIGAGAARSSAEAADLRQQIMAQQSFVDGIQRRMGSGIVPWSEASPSTSSPAPAAQPRR